MLRNVADQIIIEEAHAADDELVEAFSMLLPQLSPYATTATRDSLAGILGSPETTVLVARDLSRGRRIVGTLTLAILNVPTGRRASIEDVVVTSEARGQGIGERLTRRALEIARSKGALEVGLTSRPERQAANALYVKLGFKQRETNVYRYSFE